jgi:hypothetical protein
MHEPAEDLPAPDPAVDRLGDRQFRAWRTQVQRSMRPLRIVVSRVLGEHALKVSFPENQHPVSDFGAAV